jgi:subtilase-type serine protease
MKLFKLGLINSVACAAIGAGLLSATPADALVTPATVTPASVVDTNNTRPYWVGLGIRNEAGNGGGTCTGLLINPRTVLFAAHCVDTLAPSAYDGNSRGNRAQVGYTTDPTFGTTNLRNWLFGQDFAVPRGDGRTMVSSTMVWYDPRSNSGPEYDPATGAFLPADIALAGFDTATEILGRDAQNGIGLLFSQVNGLVPVTIGGYGTSGNGLTGARTSNTLEENFFRRLGQNVVDFLGDERSLSVGIYGQAVGSAFDPAGLRYQDLYWTDFDNPNFATQPFSANITRTASNTLDYNTLGGRAVAGESITGAGDSGSPLMTSAFGRDVSLGVLSQGSRLFFDAVGNPNDNFVYSQTFSNYGSLAGYNPLFLFWDQILINNPYKYVTARAGDGEWTDTTRWTQELDPMYFTLGAGNTLTNALPTSPALGMSDAAPNFGTVNPNPAPPLLCAFFGACPPTGGNTDPVASAGAVAQAFSGSRQSIEGDDTNSDLGAANYGLLAGTAKATASAGASTPSVQAQAGNRLTVNETPGNSDQGAYYYGQLNAATMSASTSGTVSLGQVSATQISADPAPIAGQAVNDAQSTKSWLAGRMALNSGALTGVGSTGFTPNNTNGVAGVQNSTRYFEVNLRAAGTTSMTGVTATIDRLNVRGAQSGLNIKAGSRLNTTISSYVDAGSLIVDGTFAPRQLNVLGGTVSGSGTILTQSGVLVAGGTLTPGTVGGVGTLSVTGGAGFGGTGMLGIDLASLTSADRLNVTGNLVLGGGFAANFLNGFVPDFGSSWTIASATGTTSGSFAMIASNLPGVLRATPRVAGKDVLVDITAASYTTFADCAVAGCSGLANLLDSSRANSYSTLASIYRYSDRLGSAEAASFLQALTPWDSGIAAQSVMRTNEATSSMVMSRMANVRQTGAQGASLNGLQYAAAGMRGLSAGGATAVMTDAGETLPASSNSMDMKPGWSAFGEVRGMRAKAGSAPGFVGSNTDVITGMIGVDYTQKGRIVGAALHVSNGTGKLTNAAAKSESNLVSLSIYGGISGPILAFDGYASIGSGNFDTNRTAGPFSAAGSTDSSNYSYGGALSGKGQASWGSYVPRLSMAYDRVTVDGYSETGTIGLKIGKRTVEALVARAGISLHGDQGSETALKPWGSVFLAHDFSASDSGASGLSFASTSGAAVATAAALGQDESWAELAFGFEAKVKTATIGLSYETTIDRTDVRLEQVRARVRVPF